MARTLVNSIGNKIITSELSEDPTPPATNERQIYAKNDGFYEIDSAGTSLKLVNQSSLNNFASQSSLNSYCNYTYLSVPYSGTSEKTLFTATKPCIVTATHSVHTWLYAYLSGLGGSKVTLHTSGYIAGSAKTTVLNAGDRIAIQSGTGSLNTQFYVFVIEFNAS